MPTCYVAIQSMIVTNYFIPFCWEVFSPRRFRQIIMTNGLFKLLSVASFFAMIAPVQSEEEYRVWTSAVGSTLQAKMKSVSNDEVSLERADGKIIIVPIVSLSRLDQEHVKTKLSNLEGNNIVNEQVAQVPELPDSFPKDIVSDTIPWLKKLKEEPLKFHFIDYIRKKDKTQDVFKGKYVYIHTYNINPTMGNRLAELKLLHAQYSDKGFSILTIFSTPEYIYRDSEDFSSKRKIEDFFQKSLKDYGVDWNIAYSEDAVNPVAKTISREPSFGWLIGPDGKLIHSKISDYSFRTSDTSVISLNEALKIIFK